MRGIFCAGLGLGLLLSACENSTHTGANTGVPQAACGGISLIDYSAGSLAWGVTPRPGPSVLYEPPPRAPQLENTGIWQAPPILISGASAYRCGEFIYQDWLYDDRGAAATPDPTDPHDSTGYLFSPKAGSLTYPSDPVFASNAADLVELRVKALEQATAFRVTLNTLLDPAVVAFTIALGDGGELVDWPYSANVTTPARWFLSVTGEQVERLDADNGLAPMPGVQLSLDLLRRQYTITVPHGSWDPGRTTVRMAAGFGLWDAGAGSYRQPGPVATATAPGGGAPGAAALFNVAFRMQEPLPEFTAFSGRTIADAAALAKVQAHWWRERLQADALQAGDLSGFFVEVDFAKLVDGEGDESGVPQTGFMNRIHASRFEFGQGLEYPAECGGTTAARPCEGVMRGQLLPYAIYVPESAPPPAGYGLTLFPHALSANYNQYLGSRHATQLGERGTGSIAITPSGRGPDGFYYDTAQAELFEVWADAARHYPLDPARAVMTGISMGGIGSFRVATRFPDLFARIMPVVATASGSEPALPALRNVPVMMWTSTFDELQPMVLTEQTISALFDLGYRLDSYRFETWDHLTPSTNDDYAPGSEFLLDDLVSRNPVRVTYVLRPGEDSAADGLVADKAYWLSGLRLRDPGLGLGSIDALSGGLGLQEAEAQPVVQSLAVFQGGNHEPAPYTRRLLQWAAPQAAAVQNRLSITAENIAAVTVHPQRAGLSCDAAIEVTSDGPLEVNLAGC